VAFLKAKEKRTWQPLTFAARDLQVGDPLLSVGLMPKVAGYKAYITDCGVSAKLRGEMPQVLATGRLGAVGSPVLDSEGTPVGFVNASFEQPLQSLLLNDPKLGLNPISHPPAYFLSADALLKSIADPPQGQPLKLPWTGVMQLVGLPKDVAEYFGLGTTPAIQLGEIIPGGPAAQAGLKPGQIIVKLNGKTLERGDEVAELPMIFRRQIMLMKVGTPVTLTVLDPKSKKTQDVTLQLQERPKPSNLAARFWAEDLGFGIREMVFMDAYSRRLPPTTTGALVSVIRPSSAAQTARLEGNDMIVDLNGEQISTLDQFKKAYQQFRKEHPQDAVVLVVLREGRNQTIRIEPPQ
jgi:S1-C subfamily serine protease